MSFRRIIQREAQRQGLSGYRIAALAGMSMRTVQAYLAGSRDLTGERLAKIADALGLELRPKRRSPRKGKVEHGA
jgi:transcriptional regulator with XRE-family HTH domain